MGLQREEMTREHREQKGSTPLGPQEHQREKRKAKRASFLHCRQREGGLQGRAALSAQFHKG